MALLEYSFVMVLLHAWSMSCAAETIDLNTGGTVHPGATVHPEATVHPGETVHNEATTHDGEPVHKQYSPWTNDHDDRIQCDGEANLCNVEKRSELPHHIGLVACGKHRFEETMVSIKAALLMSRQPIHVNVFADETNFDNFLTELDKWSVESSGSLTYSVYPITYPDDIDAELWKGYNKQCTTQKLFLSKLLPDVDALLYVDTDVLVMRPVEEIWGIFSQFSSSQLAALAPESEYGMAKPWYNTHARHPFYPPRGVNAGVMLMNLTRMRQVDWVEHIVAYFDEYKARFKWGDQDMMNVYFHFFPEHLHIMYCQWNYRPDHCIYGADGGVCKHAELEGVKILQGSRRVFHNDDSNPILFQPRFKAVYQAFKDHPLHDSLKDLVERLEKNIKEAPDEKYACKEFGHLFTKGLRKLLQLGTDDEPKT